MRPIYLNMRHLTQPLSGMQRYAEELALALDSLLFQAPHCFEGVSVIGLSPPGMLRRPDFRHIVVQETPGLGGHAWEQVTLWRAARDGVLVSLAGSGPMAHPRHVLALHDANVFVNPRFFARGYGLWHRTLRPRIARRAHALVTISAFSKAELARHCGVSEDRFTIIGDSAEHIVSAPADSAILKRADLTPGRYALCVGNQSPNKNIALAVKAFALARPDGVRLAVAGGATAQLAAATLREDDWIARLGRVTDAELRALYENAGVFLFPSVYEGFGVPPLEAMTLGCPVLAARRAAMPEVLGDAARYFDGDDVDDFAAALVAFFALGEDERRRLVAAGREQAARYSWRRGADKLMALIAKTAAA